jgi:hypothetical protein
MKDRLKFIAHQGQQILSVDVSNCKAPQVEDILRKVPEIVTTLPLRSALIFVDFTGASLTAETLRVMKETAVFDKPFVKKSAWIGTEIIPSEFTSAMNNYSGRQFPVFGNREEALEWLVKD